MILFNVKIMEIVRVLKYLHSLSVFGDDDEFLFDDGESTSLK